MASKRNNCYTIFCQNPKFLACALCLVGFFGNTFVIFKHFIENKTITSQDVQKSSKLFLPSMTICSLSGFKEMMNEYHDLELQSYLDKTLDLDEILVSAEDMSLQDMYKNPETWQITTVYSQYKGRCHTIKYNKKVRKFQTSIFINICTLLCTGNLPRNLFISIFNTT